MTSMAVSVDSALRTGVETDDDALDVRNGTADGEEMAQAVVTLLRRPRWQSLAECRGEPVEMFIPDHGGPSARAKQLCARCTVRAECLKYTLAIPDLVGYWAGTNEPRASSAAFGSSSLTARSASRR